MKKDYSDLLKWLDRNNADQAAWITQYLNNKGIKTDYSTPFSAVFNQNKHGLAHHLNTAEGRELIKKLRGAWYQTQYRKRTGRQVSFQLPRETVRQLEHIAKYNHTSRTQTICQIIDMQFYETKEEKKQNKIAKAQWKKEQEKLNAKLIKQNQIIESLVMAVANELKTRAYYEHNIGEVSQEEIYQISPDQEYKDLLFKLAENTDNELPDLKLIKLTVSRIIKRDYEN